MILSRTFRRFVGVFLIVIGIVLCCGIIAYQYHHCSTMYYTEVYKTQMYDSLLDYFLEVSTGPIFLSIFCVGVFMTSGILTLQTPSDNP